MPVDGNQQRFVDSAEGTPLLHLIRQYSGGEYVLRLCDDSTGLLVGPTDRRLAPAGVYLSNLRGESYHKTACRRGDFSPGPAVGLKREPDNPHAPFAVAVTADAHGTAVAAYVNKQTAPTLAKLLDSVNRFTGDIPALLTAAKRSAQLGPLMLPINGVDF